MDVQPFHDFKLAKCVHANKSRSACVACVACVEVEGLIKTSRCQAKRHHTTMTKTKAGSDIWATARKAEPK